MHTTIGRFTSTTLAGAELTVPDGLGRPTLLLFAFAQRQQPDVESWLPAVPKDGSVRVLEVPVLARRWAIGRRLIDGGMASNMDQRTREQTMCVYTDVAAFRRDVLGLDTTAVVVALVQASGSVAWHATGASTPAGLTALRDAVATLDV